MPEQRMIPYADYHERSWRIKDIDPSYSMLRYLCDRFELNTEQRFWLAFLYATCYCGPTVFYMYNEFPDFENVDSGRLQRWWNNNKSRLVFQTDRRWIRSNNQFVEMFQSYRSLFQPYTQEEIFRKMDHGNSTQTYDTCYWWASNIKYMGRFSLFLYLEAVHVVTGFPMLPPTMDIIEAKACVRGLSMAYSNQGVALLPESLQYAFDQIVKSFYEKNQEWNPWNIETTLCAYGKYTLGKRYIGYYIDRQAREITKMEKMVPEGVDWSVLWDYRRETFEHQYLMEITGHDNRTSPINQPPGSALAGETGTTTNPSDFTG